MFRDLYSFYRSAEWLKLMRLIKQERVNEHGEIICGHCGEPIVLARDCVGHHAIPLTSANVSDVEISLSPKLIMLVHFACHNRLHNRLGMSVPQRVYLVWGAPLSGKTSWVMKVKGRDDLVVDVDLLYRAVTGLDVYDKPEAIKPNVFGLRDLLIDDIRIRKGKWTNAFVIGGYPLISERERVANMLGAEAVFIDETKDTCVARLHADESRRNYVADWEKYIREWFETRQLPPFTDENQAAL